MLTPSDSEGLLLLNATAAWIWQNRNLPNLSAAYAEVFDISAEQAESDITQTFAQWSQAFRSAEPQFPASVKIRINQSTFLIEFDSPMLAGEVFPRIAALAIAGDAEPEHRFRLSESPHGAQVYKNGELFATEPLITGVRAQLLQELTRLAENERDFSAILHGGACGTKDGCVILAGASFAGKSTVCRALMQKGLLCYSDDSACLTKPDFQVAGMPFALSMRETPPFIPSNLNGSSPTASVKALLFVNYQRNGPIAELTPLDAFECLLGLQQSGFWVEHSQDAIESFLAWISRTAAYRLKYSDLESGLPMILKLVDHRA